MTVMKTIELHDMLTTSNNATLSLTPLSDKDTQFSPSALRLCNPFTNVIQLLRERVILFSSKEVTL